MIYKFSLAFSNHVQATMGKLVILLCGCLQEKTEEKGKLSGFGSFLCISSRMSGLYWLDGQQAAKFEVLYHWELLQTLCSVHFN